MKTYYLVTESGPRHMKTFVSVPNLLGCMANARTTEAALEAAPDEIRHYLRFLKRHGEDVDPDAPFETEILEEVISKTFAGEGSFTMEADREPLSAEEVETYTRRLEWMREELIALVGKLDQAAYTADGTEHSKRPIRRIVQHIIGAEAAQLATIIKGMTDVNRLARSADDESVGARHALPLLDVLAQMRAILIPRLLAMTKDERGASRMAGAHLVTARRMMRGMLEHSWQHIREIERRVLSFES